jgi:Domain of unknown function (DUF5673)
VSQLSVNQKIGNSITNSKLNSTPRFGLVELFSIATNICCFTILYYGFLPSPKLDFDLLFIYLVVSGFLIFAGILPLLDKVELRERGIYGGYFTIKWNEIEAYKLENEDNILHIQHKSFWPIRRHLVFQVPRNNRNEIMALLDSYLPDQNSE